MVQNHSNGVFMDKLMIIGIVVFLCVLMVIYTQMTPQAKDASSLKIQLQKAFPQFKVIEKHGTVMICEISHRNEPEELVFIRVDPQQQKSIRPFGRRVTMTYAKYPSVKEIKKDAMPYLHAYLK